MFKLQTTEEFCSEEVPCNKCYKQIKVGERMIVVAKLKRVDGIGGSPVEWVPTTEVCYHFDCFPE
jgi:hypothetical protein